MASENAFSLSRVEFAYPNATEPALTQIDLTVAQGEWVALLGSNGSGKSTLARVLNALLNPTQGACSVFGLDSADISNCTAIRQKVAMVFQNPDDQIVATVVEEDVAFGPENLAIQPAEIKRRVDWALQQTGLTALKERATYTLSGGQKQRLAIAGALALQPHCLILDEATAMLDPQARNEMLSLLKQLHLSGVGIIQITHRLEEVISADRIVLMQRGKVIWSGPPPLFFEEQAERAGFEIPTLIRLRDRLATAGFIPAGSATEVERIAEAVCQSMS